MKSEFIEIFTNNIKRDGAEELLKYLQKSDFFDAPASGKFHCSYPGGLCEHSVNVYKRLLLLAKEQYGDKWDEIISHETIAICGLLHDVCKIDYYYEEYRNVKINNEWVQKSFYSVKEVLPYGHGEKSVYIINGFIKLTRNEALAINWHMGGFDDRVRGGNHSISMAYERDPLCVMLHVADLMSTYIDEHRNNQI